MLKLVKLIGSGMLILLLLPLAFWLSGWHWLPAQAEGWQLILFAFTETVTRPAGVVTTLLLGGWLLWKLRHEQRTLRQRLVVVLSVIIVVWGGQGINSLIKLQVKEARPYVVWLQSEMAQPTEDFYQVPAVDRSARIHQFTRDNPLLPGWLTKHWAAETGYSFPSGHSMFAACWALLMLFWLWPRGHVISVVMTFIWAMVVIWSRLALGMHWPQDVSMSVINAGWLVIIVGLTINSRYITR
ncbi:phosphatase PAP2 family protein [Tatumella morbirosei]|uniref:phosphatase PAP2 family protein n=1 Tax=Tatumella morbirosei TaxID=642227 RepID=UPI00062A4838|nr:phosphatase PAP2 family protein [Tatumella morbirosei]